MKLTKYNHACVIIEEDGQKVIIDPGAFMPALPDVTGTAALVITHEHPDHFYPDHINDIVAANPDIEIFAAEGIAEKLPDLSIATAVPGEEMTAGSFTFTFFGGRHALIHKTIPRPNNVGVLINKAVYYPGDSFDTPNVSPQVLLVPTSAPWLKIGEAIDFIDQVKPKICIPTHNALQSEIGESLTGDWLRGICQKHGITFRHLPPSESIDF
ncbi:MAG TPA: MBL fold metallo-hydrolase [Candidatus Saccharimonadales bacterium]|nr:MBL fold metallo-hydrolase [Candidatus Saccharimonadales bacterium]